MVVRIGLVGCGRVSQTHHGPALADIEGAQVTALVDPMPEGRVAMARHHPGAVFYKDLATPIGLDELDAVVICTPPSTHADLAIQALEAGLHVYVEKPLALDDAQADAMHQAADAADRVAMVGHNFRFHPSYMKARDDLGAGRFGKLYAIRTLFTSEARQLPGWKAEHGQGGDPIIDLAIHHLDIIHFLTDQPIVRDSLHSHRVQTDHGGLAVVSGTLENGVPLTITTGQVTGQDAHKVDLLCSGGHVEIDLTRKTQADLGRPNYRMSAKEKLHMRGKMLRETLDIRHLPEPSFRAALRHFVELADADDPASCAAPFQTGRAALALALQAMKTEPTT